MGLMGGWDYFAKEELLGEFAHPLNAHLPWRWKINGRRAWEHIYGRLIVSGCSLPGHSQAVQASQVGRRSCLPSILGVRFHIRSHVHAERKVGRTLGGNVLQGLTFKGLDAKGWGRKFSNGKPTQRIELAGRRIGQLGQRQGTSKAERFLSSLRAREKLITTRIDVTCRNCVAWEGWAPWSC